MNKKYYRRAIQMAWPSVLESFFISLAGMIDTMMVAGLGNFAVAAVGLTTQPKFLSLTVFMAINVAVSALVARRKGERDKKGANRVFVTAAALTLGLCVIITFATVFFADDIMHLAGSQPDTHESAVQYFRIIMGGIFFNLVAMVINSAQRGSGNTKIAFTTNLTSSIVNIIFNYLLIGGNFGFPALGIRGAAIATVLGSAVAMVMSIISLFHRESLIDFSYIVKHKIQPAAQAVRSIVQLSSSLFFENIAMRIGFLTTALTAAHLGTNPFAIYNAGMNLLNLGFSFGDGMQVAAVALSGRALGAGEKEEAILYGRVCQRIGLGISILLSIFFFFFGRSLMEIYFTDEDMIVTGTYVTQFIMVIVLLQISQIIYGGCLRSGGDVKYTLFTGIMAVTIIRTIVTLISVHVFHFGLYGTWLGVFSDQLCRYILLRRRFQKGYWTQIRI